MFDSDLEKGEGSVVRRRTFLFTSASALAGAILWSLRRPSVAQATAANGRLEEVTIVEFSDSGAPANRWPRRKVMPHYLQTIFGKKALPRVPKANLRLRKKTEFLLLAC